MKLNFMINISLWIKVSYSELSKPGIIYSLEYKDLASYSWKHTFIEMKEEKNVYWALGISCESLLHCSYISTSFLGFHKSLEQQTQARD